MGATQLRRLALLACLPTAVWAQPEPAAPAAAPASAPFDMNDPEQCVACHETIVNEWKASMHARSHHSQDPVYAAMR